MTAVTIQPSFWTCHALPAQRLPSLHTSRAEMTAFRESGKTILAIPACMAIPAGSSPPTADEVFFCTIRAVAMIEGYPASRSICAACSTGWGVTVNIFRVGEFKSAIEPFEAGPTCPKPTMRRALYLYGDLWNAYTRAAEKRARPAGRYAAAPWRYRRRSRKSLPRGDLARAALDAGLVDQLVARIPASRPSGCSVSARWNTASAPPPSPPDTTDFF